MYDWSPQSAGLTNPLGREFFSTPLALSKWLTKNRHLEESKGAEMPKNATTPHTINLPLARPLGYAGCSKFALQCWGFVFAKKKSHVPGQPNIEEPMSQRSATWQVNCGRACRLWGLAFLDLSFFRTELPILPRARWLAPRREKEAREEGRELVGLQQGGLGLPQRDNI